MRFSELKVREESIIASALCPPHIELEFPLQQGSRLMTELYGTGWRV